ncbi:MAG: GlsB/YeaQ/YmgE family stress response membrane protein [Saprospiraceae bacterium]|nr:GlsB/YeaQ/YmgE family stress response membrane protein [Saprospiraceae bacterium]
MENLVGYFNSLCIGSWSGFGANMAKPNGQSMIMNLILGAVGGNLGNLLGGVMGVLGDLTFQLVLLLQLWLEVE